MPALAPLESEVSGEPKSYRKVKSWVLMIEGVGLFEGTELEGAAIGILGVV